MADACAARFVGRFALNVSFRKLLLLGAGLDKILIKIVGPLFCAKYAALGDLQKIFGAGKIEVRI